MPTPPAYEADAPQRGPARATERAIAPDLARGLMLLLIAVSNTMFFLWAADYEGAAQHPVAQHAADSLTQVLMVVTLDMRIYPLFAFLFGYGMMQLFLRQTAAGTPERRAVGLLRRRSLWLLVFGFVHAALLLPTDVLGAYGVISLVLGWLFLRRTDRALLTWSAVGSALLVLLLIGSALLVLAISTGAVPAYEADGSAGTAATTEASGAAQTSYLASMADRLTTWPFISALTIFGLTAPVAMLLGFWAARHRVLEEPHHHLRLLRGVAVVGITIGWLGPVPAALAEIGVLDLSSAPGLNELSLLGMQWSTGLAGGLGYVALFALLAHWIARRSRAGVPVVVAVTAIGKRSLSCYLTHSLLMSPLLSAWGFGLGASLTSASMALVAIAIWLVTVAGAYALERAGRRGPAEVLLRRLMYGRPRPAALGS